MKALFLICLGLLIGWGLLTFLGLPEVQSDKPILYWVTDSNPARQEQIKAFHEWLAENGYPEFELRLDVAGDPAKVMIQGISGVSGDIIDAMYGQVYYFNDAGILADLTEPAAALGFGVERTYPAIAPSLMPEGVQRAFPCNVSVQVYLVNKDAFTRIGMEPPPMSWDLETFERIGSEWVERANKGLPFRRFFFVDSVPLATLRRSMGLSTFNETLTKSTLDHPAAARSLALLHRWTYELHLLPDSAEKASFVTSAGSWGANFQLFSQGNFAQILSGRWALIQLRQFKDRVDLGVTRPPHEVFENTVIYTRAAAIYEGGKHKDLAAYFLKFLTSERYNRMIIDGADALPPDPEMTQTEAFLRPVAYPNEWDFHEHLPRIASEIGVPVTISPYVSDATVQRIDEFANSSVSVGRLSPEEAAARSHQELNAEIERTLKDLPELRPEYERLLEQQARIDALKAAGEPIPAGLIRNPFHMAYYRKLGMLAE